MRLHVGVIGKSPGWSMLLAQEGVSYSMNVNSVSSDEHSVVIVGDDSSNDTAPHLRKYLNNGGAVLCSAKVFGQMSGNKPQQSFVKYAYPKRDSEFIGVGLLDIEQECLIPDEANEIFTDNGKPCVYVDSYGKGYVVVLPFDAGKLVLDDRTATKSFYADRNRLPFEHVSLVSKGSLRKLISRCIELLHHRRGLPFVHRWYFPNNAQSLFALRIDTDGASGSEIKSLYKLLSANQHHTIPGSWFIDVQSQQTSLSEYISMSGHEIGLHCYTHKPYNDFESSNEDIKCAKEILAKVSIIPKGFAAPYGMWNHEIARAIETNDFAYSSEFSYDYDNLPSFPQVGETCLNVLQLPVHPISIGSLRRQGFTDVEMTGYYKLVMEEKLATREPLFFYHHPKDHHEPVLEEIFLWIEERSLPIVRLIDYAEWWKKRHTSRHRIQVNSSELLIETENDVHDVWFHITKPDGMEAFVKPQTKIDLTFSEWMPRPSPVPLAPDIHRIRSFNPWIQLIQSQDKIYKFLHRG
jgi:peptidoglycan/xylan/chitin deacetylase (PgdA/CDA1 family)